MANPHEDLQSGKRSREGDVHQITQLIYRYCRSMDRMDLELGYSIWHDDAEADYGEAIYQGSGRGFIDHVTEFHRTLVAQSHQIGNITIELEGDRAASESYVTVMLRLMQDGQLMQMTFRARYLDRWSNRGGRWGIDKRVCMQDFDEIHPVHATQFSGLPRRDRSDPSYRILDLTQEV